MPRNQLLIIFFVFIISLGVLFMLFQANGNEIDENERLPSTEQPAVTYEEILVDIEENDAVLLDVRTPEEYAEGYVPPAVNLPLQDIQDGDMPDATPDQLIYLYCRTGSRSAQAAALLRHSGYRVVDLGGLQDMRDIGAELTTEEETR